MPISPKKHLLRATISVTGVIVIAKIFGFIKQTVVAAHFGTTIETDLINLSQNFIGDIQYVLVQVLLTAFTSVYIRTKHESEPLAKKLTGNALKAFSGIALGITLLILLCVPLIARIIAPSYSESLSQELTYYLRIFCPVLVCYIWHAISHALLNAHSRFVPGELVSLIQSVILIACILLFQARWGIKVLVYGFFFYTIFNAALLVFLCRKDISLPRGNPFSDPSVRMLLRMTGPLFLSYAMVYINQQVDKILASGLPAGTVTAMGYAAVLSNLVGTFIVSFCSILYTHITSHISRHEHTLAATQTVRSTSLLILVFLPISIITVLCSHDIVSAVFERGAYTSESVSVSAAALMGYGFSFIPLIFREQFSRFQYGYQNSRMPMINSVISIFVNIGLSILFCRYWGVFGIALASSIAACVCAILNVFTARRLNRALSLRPLLNQLPFLAAGGLACYFITGWALRCFQAYSSLVRFVLVALCAGAGYVLFVSPIVFKLLKQHRASGPV